MLQSKCLFETASSHAFAVENFRAATTFAIFQRLTIEQTALSFAFFLSFFTKVRSNLQARRSLSCTASCTCYSPHSIKFGLFEMQNFPSLPPTCQYLLVLLDHYLLFPLLHYPYNPHIGSPAVAKKERRVERK